MLNIGKLSPGAAEYYVGEVASSAEDYYLGAGEAPGRWVGSLARELGLSGEVDADDFRRLLDGRHPATGEYLVSAIGSAGRAQARRDGAPERKALMPAAEYLDSVQVAARLGVGVRQVQKLLAAGERVAQAPSETTGTGQATAPVPRSYLVGTKADVQGAPGLDRWLVARGEVERYAAQRREAKARPGYDLTLRPPKSVSVLWALGSDRERRLVRAAHREAVDAVVAYYESQAVFGRTGAGGKTRVLTHGIAAAAFDHRTSRAGDPLLHTHVVTANMTRTVEGKWRTIDGRPLFEHGKAAGFLYQAHLRHALTRDAGLEWHPVVNGYAEVVGVPEAVIRAFSKRREEIEDLVAESGLTSAKAHQAATLASRRAKDYGVDADTLADRWRAEADALGFDSAAVDACFHRAEVAAVAPGAADRLFDRLAGPEGLTERASTFTRRDALEALATALGASVSAAELGVLTDRFLASDRVVPLSGDGRHRAEEAVSGPGGHRSRLAGEARFTTPDLAELEDRVLAWAEHGHGRPAPAAAPEAVDGALARRPELSAEQAAMVRAVCASAEAIQPVAGRPGAGKTYATDACVAALVASGVPVAGCAVSAVAAAELEAATSLERATGRPARTVARLLAELDHPTWGGFAPGTVLVVDEASMVGTRDLARLGTHLARAGGSMKLVGDPDQHGSVDTGGLFRELVRRKGDDLVRLVENNRQVDEGERLAIEEYRRGRVAEALDRYDRAGKVVRSATAGESYDAMVADWYVERSLGRADPMIAGPNATRRALNDRARALLKAEGALTGPALVVAGREFQVGDDVVCRQNDRSLAAPDGRAFVKNGSTGRVAEVDLQAGELVVAFDAEGTIRLPQAYLAAGRVEHGYARTTYGVQGATHDQGRYAPGDASSFEEGYVALTRARRRTRIYVVDGSVDRGDELVHGTVEAEEASLDSVAASLGRRSAKGLLHEADPRVAVTAAVLAGTSLRTLRAERERLDAVLAAAPPSVSSALTSETRKRDALLAQRQAWLDTATAHETILTKPAGGRRAYRNTVEERLRRASREVAALERAIADSTNRIGSQAERDAAHRAFFAEHSEHAERRALVQAAEIARELQVRIAAVAAPPEGLSRRLGPAPDGQRERLTWNRCVEETAVYLDRYGEPGGAAAGDRWAAVLGPRPGDHAARLTYDEVVAVLDEGAATSTLRSPEPVAAELG